MCLSIAAAGLGIIGNVITQSAQAKRQNAAYQANALNATAAASEQYAQINLASIQESAKGVQQKLANAQDVLKAKGTALASTQNSGQSTSSVLHDIERQGAKADNVTDINIKNAKIETASNKEAVKTQTQGRIDSVAQGTEPDLFAAAISGLGSYLGAQTFNTKYDSHNTGESIKK